MSFDYMGYRIVVADGDVFAFKGKDVIANADTVDDLIRILNEKDEN